MKLKRYIIIFSSILLLTSTEIRASDECFEGFWLCDGVSGLRHLSPISEGVLFNQRSTRKNTPV